MDINNSVVLITGAAIRVGRSIALYLAKKGAHISFSHFLDDEPWEETLKEIRGCGVEAIATKTDTSQKDQVDRLVESTVHKFGKIDVLINSAYVGGKFEPIETADLEDWKATMDINFFGTMALTQAVIPEMKRTGGGSIVMINTMVTRVPLPWQGGYGASKGALKVATAHLAKEMGVHGIRVNSAFMGWMWGPPVEGYLKGAAKQQGTTVEALRKEIGKNIPLGDIPDDADCARVAIFLASDYSRAMTGACLDVNGGEYLPS